MVECNDYYYFDLIQLMMNNEVINIFPEDNFTTENDFSKFFLPRKFQRFTGALT